MMNMGFREKPRLEEVTWADTITLRVDRQVREIVEHGMAVFGTNRKATAVRKILLDWYFTRIRGSGEKRLKSSVNSLHDDIKKLNVQLRVQNELLQDIRRLLESLTKMLESPRIKEPKTIVVEGKGNIDKHLNELRKLKEELKGLV